MHRGERVAVVVPDYEGPESQWVLLNREANRDIPVGSSRKGFSGNSEVCMRNMYQAWSQYMSAQ